MKHGKNISFILILLLIVFSVQCCSSTSSANYGVNLHYRSGWGHGRYNHKNYYHHRPTVRLHVRTAPGRRLRR